MQPLNKDHFAVQGLRCLVHTGEEWKAQWPACGSITNARHAVRPSEVDQIPDTECSENPALLSLRKTYLLLPLGKGSGMFQDSAGFHLACLIYCLPGLRTLTPLGGKFVQALLFFSLDSFTFPSLPDGSTHRSRPLPM